MALPKVGSTVYVAHPGEVARARVIEHGTGGRNLRHVPRHPVVVREIAGSAQGDEFCMSADRLFVDPMAASIYSAELAEELGQRDEGIASTRAPGGGAKVTKKQAESAVREAKEAERLAFSTGKEGDFRRAAALFQALVRATHSFPEAVRKNFFGTSELMRAKAEEARRVTFARSQKRKTASAGGGASAGPVRRSGWELRVVAALIDHAPGDRGNARFDAIDNAERFLDAFKRKDPETWAWLKEQAAHPEAVRDVVMRTWEASLRSVSPERRADIVRKDGGGGARTMTRGAPPWELHWKPMMNATAFLGQPEAKHLKGRQAYSAHGVEPSTEYHVEPNWEHGRVAYTADFKPRHSSSHTVSVEEVGKGPGPLRFLGKRYATLDAARAACMRHAQTEGMKLFGDRYALRAAQHAEDLARYKAKA